MSDPARESQAQVPSASALPVMESPGSMIRAAREAQGLHIGALAVILKVPVKKLEALEADRFDLLLDTVFTRSLALSVCRTLKIDPSRIMLGLPQSQTPTIKTDESGLNTAFKTTTTDSHAPVLSHLLNPIGLGVLVLLAITVVIFFWPMKMPELISGIQTPSTTVGGASISVRPIEADSQTSKLGESPVLAASDSAAQVSAATPPAVASAAQPVMAPASLASAPVPINAAIQSDLLLITARGVSWIEVTDANGVSQLRKTTADGDVFKVSGSLPLSVVVGRADVISVLVRGQPLELTAVSKDNVARFEVK